MAIQVTLYPVNIILYFVVLVLKQQDTEYAW